MPRFHPPLPQFAVLAAFAFVAPLHAQEPTPGSESQYFRSLLTGAVSAFENGDFDAARDRVLRALERDARNLDALDLLARIGESAGDVDTAVHSWHRWIEFYDAQDRPPVAKKVRKATYEKLASLDEEAATWTDIQGDFSDALLDLGKDYRKRKDWLGAVAVYKRLLAVNPDDSRALTAMREIQRTGGKEVAVEDVYAGTDPTGGMSAERIAELDADHDTWDTAFTKRTDNYRYKTDAGFLVLETSSIAMEQMNRFYRRFFRYKLDGGKTPPIEIRVFKNRDEYLELGSSPAEWSGGQFTGSAVETYVGGTTGQDSIREMYRTLFHEAAHQFVSLAGRGVPGWLNEAYASFFEGCVILSNGTVQWNKVPPGRMIPLARRLERGFMQSPDEAAPDGEGQFPSPETAPTFRMVVENEYRWGPPWYAPTWGVVYFLYNYRAEDGRPVYRDALHEYFTSFKRGRPKDPVAHFEEIVLEGARLSPVETIDALTPIWKDWILELRAYETGKKQRDPQRLLKWAAAALDRKERDAALEFLEDAHDENPDDAEILWQLANVLDDDKQRSRSAATFRRFVHVIESRGQAEQEAERLATAKRKIRSLDTFAEKLESLDERATKKGLDLARSYESNELPTMALEIARRVSAYFGSDEAIAYYRELVLRTGKSLSRWRVAYNEVDLDGWSGALDAYQAYGALIRARSPKGDGGLLTTRELTCDVTFDGDFSLESEMRIVAAPKDGYLGELMGLCFGRKTDVSFHAVVLHPAGYLDISTNNDGLWTPHDHREVRVGDAWHTLRIDVTGRTLDVFLDGKFVRSMEFPSAAVVRGGFGLITGGGEAEFRNVRLLARDPDDHAARVERELLLAKLADGSADRQDGSFRGIEPPAVQVDAVVGDAVPSLEDCRGKPVMLLFWSPAQDRVIPCTDYYAHLVERGSAAGLETLIVCPWGTEAAEIQSYLGEHPIPGARVGVDNATTYEDYFIKEGFFGMPRVVLIGPDGTVRFEGEPGMRSGAAWKPGDQPTFMDAAFDELIGG